MTITVDPLTHNGWITIGVCIFLFAVLLTNKFATDLVFFFCLMILVFSKVITEDEAVKGFGNTSLLTVAALFIVAHGLDTTGAIRLVTKKLFKSDVSLTNALLRMMIPLAALSAFFNNTPLVAMFMPEVIAWSSRIKQSPSRLLMPMCHAIVLGGQITIMGTSTNILVNGLLEQSKKPKFSLLSIAPIGLAITGAGIIVLAALTRWIIPDRGTASETFADPREYTAELIVDEYGPLANGRRLADISVPTISGKKVAKVLPVEIIRDGEVIPAPSPSQVIRGGDRLVFGGALAHILPLQHIEGLRLATDGEFTMGSKAGKVSLYTTPSEWYRLAKVYFRKARRAVNARLGRVDPADISPSASVVSNSSPSGAHAPAEEIEVTARETSVAVNGPSEESSTDAEAARTEIDAADPEGERIDVVATSVPEEDAQKTAGTPPPAYTEGPHSVDAKGVVVASKLREDRRLFEVVISHKSPLIGKRVGEGLFRQLYDAAVVAVARKGTLIRSSNINDWVLESGDFILVDAKPSFVDRHARSEDFYLVTVQETEAAATATPIPGQWRAHFALACLIVMIVLAAVEKTTMFMASWACAITFILTGIVPVVDARKSFDLNVLITIAGSLGISQALQSSGAAKTIATALVKATGGDSNWGALAGVYLAGLVITEFVTNNAAASLVYPIAMAVAKTLNVSYKPYALAVMFSSSLGFAFPWGYQCTLMVYGPGRYKLVDFLKMGIILDIVTAGICIGIIPLLHPFK